MSITEPVVVPSWSSGNAEPSADDTQPSNGFIQAGWTHTSGGPQRGYFNWLLRQLHNGLAYYMSRGGAPLWNAGRDYVVGSVVRDPNNGYLYQCFVAAPATGTAPSVKRDSWDLLPQATAPRMTWRQNFQSDESLVATSTTPVPSADVKPGLWQLNPKVYAAGTAALHFFSTGDGVVFTSGFAKITPSAGASDIASLQYATPGVKVGAGNVCLAVEWNATMSAVGSNGADIWMVVGNGGPLDVDSSYIAIVKRKTDTNWQSVTKSSTTQGSFVDLGVAPTASDPSSVTGNAHRFKVIWVGASHNGSVAKALVFVDGVLKATHTTNLPSGGTPAQLYFGVINNGTTGRILYVNDVAADASFV
jgi:hypothetical protein